MFELPEAKRVRRSDLRSPSFSPPPTGTNTTYASLPPDAAQQKLHSLLSTLLPLDLPSPTHVHSCSQSPLSNADQPPPEDESEYDFPLFTPHPTTSTSQPTIHRVTLRTPTPPQTTEDIYLTSYYALAATQHRPLAYYFPPPTPSPTLLSCAISGEDILAHARRDKWLGQTHSWRLITISTTPPPAPSSSRPLLPSKKKKCKPGKKRRIYLRQAALKKEAQKLALEARRQAEAERKKKEEEEANLKRVLKNRERKAKKRAREKAKKLAAAGGGGLVGAGAGEGGERMDVDG